MNANDLNKLFEHSDDTVIDSAAKRRAIDVAMAEFAAQVEDIAQTTEKVTKIKKEQSWYQGFLNNFRPTRQTQTSGRKNNMMKQHLRWWYGSAVTASVVLFAGFIALRDPKPFNQPDTDQQPAFAKEYETQSTVSTVSETPFAPAENLKKQISEEAGKVIGSAADQAPPPKPATSEKVKSNSRNIVGSSTPSRSRTELDDTGADSLQRGFSSSNQATPKTEMADSRLAQKPKPVIAEKKAGLLNNIDTDPALRQAKVVPSSKAMTEEEVILEALAPSEPASTTELVNDRERFEQKEINPVKLVSEEPVSTFSIDVDTTSYSFARRKLNRGVLPEKDAVRVEEFLNYFDYEYPNATSKAKPFSTNVIVGDSPWNPGNKLIHIGIKGYELDTQPQSNLVFLLDVSGSMSDQDKLPLVKQSMGLMLDQLLPDDNVAIVVYAGAAGTVLEPTKVKEKQKILTALNRLNAGGSTAGAAGIKLAYQLAEQNFDKNAVNRIILATDGDFNVGISDPNKLKTFVERKRDKGIYLSVLGFGQGNYYDHMMQALAQNGNGIAAYIDTLSEAQKVLVNEATSSLFPIARDVKIQIEFNPTTVAEYRLIGYETRHLNREDFNNDKVDAGDIGSGHTVTAIYEITPVGSESQLIDASRYAANTKADDEKSNEYALLKLRFKLPEKTKSNLIEQVISNKNSTMAVWQSREFQFSASVSGFAELLRGGKYLGEWSYDDVINMALKSRGEDIYGYRNEFVQLVRKAKIASDM